MGGGVEEWDGERLGCQEDRGRGGDAGVQGGLGVEGAAEAGGGEGVSVAAAVGAVHCGGGWLLGHGAGRAEEEDGDQAAEGGEEAEDGAGRVRGERHGLSITWFRYVPSHLSTMELC